MKLDTYECGVETEGPSWVQFHVGYYVFALLFVVFDIETIFLYPWAVAFRSTRNLRVRRGRCFIGILGYRPRRTPGRRTRLAWRGRAGKRSV